MSISFFEKPESLILEILPSLEYVANFFQIIELINRVPFSQLDVDCFSSSPIFNLIKLKINRPKLLASKTRVELICVYKSDVIPNPLQPELPGNILRIQTDDSVLVSGDFVHFNPQKHITTVPFKPYMSSSNINRRRELFSLDGTSVNNVTESVALTVNEVITAYNAEIEKYL